MAGPVRAVLIALALAGAAVAHSPALAATPPKVGQSAPDAALTLVGGRKLRLADLRGQVVIINFWATWCGPCMRELPILDGFYRQTHQFGLQVYTATTEDSQPEYDLRRLFAAMAITPVRRLSGPYAPIGGAVPSNFVIDRAGVVRYAEAGAFDLDTLNAVILPLLREPAPDPAPAPAQPAK